MRTETGRQEERIQNKARLPIGGNRQRHLFRGRFLCKHFSLLSRSFRTLAAWRWQERLYRDPQRGCSCCCALRSFSSPDSGARSLRSSLPVFTVRACLSPCSLCCHLYNLCACQHCHPPPPSHSHHPINQPYTTIPLSHSTQISTPRPLARRNPPSRTLGSETRHPRTDKPARVARCCCAALHSICFNGHFNACLYSFARDKYLLHHRPFATVYGRVLLALT